MLKLPMAVVATLAIPCAGQEWLPGWGDPKLGSAPWAMTTWDPDGDGPLGNCPTIGGTCSDPSTSAALSYWDGRGWVGVRTTANTGVFGLGTHEGQLWACGGSTWGSNPAVSGNVAWFDRTRWWAAPIPSVQVVDSLHSFNGTLIGGTNSGSRLWDGAAWSNHSSLPASSMYQMTTHNGELIVGGNGVFRYTGSGWQAWPVAFPPGSVAVGGVASYNGELYATHSTSGVYRWTGSAWVLVPGLSGRVGDLTVTNGELWATGTNVTLSGTTAIQCPTLRYDGVSWKEPGPGLNSFVYSGCGWRGRTVIGGSFTRGSHQWLNGVALMDGEGFSPLGSGMGPGSGTSAPGPLALCEFQNDLYAGGSFTTADGQPALRIARWDGSQWHGVGGGLNGRVTDMVVHEGRLIVAGTFTAAGSVSAGVAAWDGSSWSPMGAGFTGPFSCGSSCDKPRLLSSQGRLLITVPLTAGSIVAEWNGSAWAQLGASFTGMVNGIAFWNGTLFAGGTFTGVGTTTNDFIVKWNGSAWVQATPSASQEIYSLTERGGEMLATTNGISATTGRKVSRWNGTFWAPFTFGVNVPGAGAYKAIPVGPDVVVVGSFHHVFTDGVFNGASKPTSYVAVWRDRRVCSADFNGDGDFGTDQDIEAYFACLAGNCCAGCGEADFDGDGDVGTDQDIEAFFRVLGGGAC